MSKRFALLGIFAMAVLQILWHGFLLPPERMPVAVVLGFALLPIAKAILPSALLDNPNETLATPVDMFCKP